MTRTPKARYSLEGRLAALLGLLVVLVAAVSVGIYAWFGVGWLALVVAISVGLPLCWFALNQLMHPVEKIFQALTSGLHSLRDRDFSVSIGVDRRDELGVLVDAYNRLGGVLRDERQSLFQRELLLDTVIHTTPIALVLCNARNAIVLSNAAARHLFLGGDPLDGRSFPELLGKTPAPFREAVESARDGLFTVEDGTERDTFYLSSREFVLNTQPHRLYLFKRMTQELSRQEVSTWKNVIRVISHELNNSLAPMSSMAHSGKQMVERDDRSRLAEVFALIEERAAHLKEFIDGYARFAKLPQPLIKEVDWGEFLRSLGQTVDFKISGDIPVSKGSFDPAQLEQVMINLIKNAHEAGSEPDRITVDISERADGFLLRVADRGGAMSGQVLANALLPFYSTKRSGTGLGLPLCREIVEAHDGRLSLRNRQNGGLVVELWMPSPAQTPKARQSGKNSTK